MPKQKPMKKRAILFYWLLILIPAVAIGAAAFKLLQHEQERISRAAVASVTDRTRTLAEALQITVDALEDELEKGLRNMDEPRLEQTLLEWERTNPLVRNVFIWQEKTGLVYPVPGMASTSEEHRFMNRFAGLFSGRIPWPEETQENISVASAEKPSSLNDSNLSKNEKENQKSQSLVTSIRKMRSSQQELVDLAKEQKSLSTDRKGGWLPWFVENRLYILGWVQNREKGPVYGVELELMTLLSRLVTGFPETGTRGIVYVLKDDEGRILHQAGAGQIQNDKTADVAVSLAPQLPHWELAAYITDTSGVASFERGFFLLAGLLLATFIAAIVLGGALLTWQAHRNMRDANQKTSFVSNVSHELKTPLTSIRMYAELLADDRVNDPQKKKNYLQVIVSESQRLTRLVNNVLDFSRLEQGRKKYHPKEINVTEYLQDIIQAHSLRIKDAGMTLKTQIPGKDIIVNADRDALEQVILNLIDNAIKYASDGRELEITLSAGETTCSIRVMDKGRGVPAAHRERIFEMFHRVDDSLTAAKQGSGLGLSIARRILRDLGGDLIYEHEHTGGSCFAATLPLYPPGADT